MKSVHDKLAKIRKPRVHITYDVENNGQTEKKEIPFVVGVMGDFSGNPTKELKAFKDRKFIQIDADNFNEVMNKMSPGLNLKVKNTIAGDDSNMAINLTFNSIEDFSPDNISKQVEPIRNLIEIRTKLKDLLSKADRSENLDAILETILKDHEQLQKFSKELEGDTTNV